MAQAAEATDGQPVVDEKLEGRFNLCKSIAEETLGDLRKLLQEKEHPVCYDGFEPSGRMHIAQVQAALHNLINMSGDPESFDRE